MLVCGLDISSVFDVKHESGLLHACMAAHFCLNCTSCSTPHPVQQLAHAWWRVATYMHGDPAWAVHSCPGSTELVECASDLWGVKSNSLRKQRHNCVSKMWWKKDYSVLWTQCSMSIFAYFQCCCSMTLVCIYMHWATSWVKQTGAVHWPHEPSKQKLVHFLMLHTYVTHSGELLWFHSGLATPNWIIVTAMSIIDSGIGCKPPTSRDPCIVLRKLKFKFAQHSSQRIAWCCTHKPCWHVSTWSIGSFTSGHMKALSCTTQHKIRALHISEKAAACAYAENISRACMSQIACAILTRYGVAK